MKNSTIAHETLEMHDAVSNELISYEMKCEQILFFDTLQHRNLLQCDQNKL